MATVMMVVVMMVARVRSALPIIVICEDYLIATPGTATHVSFRHQELASTWVAWHPLTKNIETYGFVGTDPVDRCFSHVDRGGPQIGIPWTVVFSHVDRGGP